MLKGDYSRIENCVSKVLGACGYALYDVDLPLSSAATLRIFIAKQGPLSSQTVNLDDCVAVNRALDQCEEFLELLPEKCTVEISSPGVNRRLRTTEHFRQALGERVKITLNSTAHGGVLKGVLKEVDAQNFKVEEEKTKDLVQIAWPEMRKAQVDFVW